MPSNHTPNVICDRCGKAFYLKPSLAKRTRYCSMACRRNIAALGENPTETLYQLYVVEGLAIGSIMDRLGMGRSSVVRELRAVGIVPRTLSEQKTLDLARMTPDERLALTAPAHAAITGRKRSHEDLCRRAQGKQRAAKLSGDEAEIMAAFHVAEIFPIPLYSVDKFNIDFAFPEAMLAVEYNGGNWHDSPKKRASDAKKAAVLEGLGWTILVFPQINRRVVNPEQARIEAIASIVETVRQHLTPPPAAL